MVLEGVAIGGPRDGVKLMCPHDWDGRIMKKQQGPTYHTGHYRWSTQLDTWVWDVRAPATTPVPAVKAGRPLTRKRQPFAGYQYRNAD